MAEKIFYPVYKTDLLLPFFKEYGGRILVATVTDAASLLRKTNHSPTIVSQALPLYAAAISKKLIPR